MRDKGINYAQTIASYKQPFENRCIRNAMLSKVKYLIVDEISMVNKADMEFIYNIK